MSLLLGAASYPGYSRSGDRPVSTARTNGAFETFCLSVLSKDDNGLIQFNSNDYSAEQVEEGLKQLRTLGFIATIEDVAPRRRSNPLFDKRVRIEREKNKGIKQ